MLLTFNNILATYYALWPKNSLGIISKQKLILQFKVAPYFGTFAPLFDPPLVAYFDTPHMSMYSSRFKPLKACFQFDILQFKVAPNFGTFAVFVAYVHVHVHV